ncbi:MAG TPA: zinc ribbon domain-containing protein [Steroidobacteraceae bacterium]|nr:zinc ribbon domain-containing protein [Steroidobacteraceae bacterium]
MPTYEYHCASNDQLVEVQHKMSEKIHTWGELCRRAGISSGSTPLQAPVEKLMSAGFIGKAGGSGAESPSCELPMCGAGACGRCES